MKKALLIVDVQNDFLPGGALGVKEGDRVIPLINRLIAKPFDVIVASQDWHPDNHGSFAKSHHKQVGEHTKLRGQDQILWPVHCVQKTRGAEFSEELNDKHFDRVFQKGTDVEIDSYSAFFDNGHLKATGMGEYLKDQQVTDLYIAGLTTDYCVKFSVLDALKLGFRAHVIKDACRPVNLEPDDEKKALQQMTDAGASLTTTQEVIDSLAG
jgi:nicotinamidase/pyrazinamidase